MLKETNLLAVGTICTTTNNPYWEPRPQRMTLQTDTGIKSSETMASAPFIS